jgi:hypothetical protein
VVFEFREEVAVFEQVLKSLVLRYHSDYVGLEHLEFHLGLVELALLGCLALHTALYLDLYNIQDKIKKIVMQITLKIIKKFYENNK